ncbi:hypothetical protein [Chryseobacterium aquaticum]|uniref:hypothetical protein n=1 Tax=Chryseobacterium aquaticum TaxID=452084 RepID=UPI002FCA61BD
MKIIDSEDKAWFFLNENDNYYIDVNCNYSFVGFTMLIQLSKIEINEYKNQGKEYLNSLAKNIQQYALCHYKDRNVKGDIERMANEAIIEFLEENKGKV